MSRAQKLFRKWSDNIPSEAKRSEVEVLLEHYFHGQWSFGSKASHIVLRCDRLAGFSPFNYIGEITIPIRKGRYVKGFYIKNLIEAINVIKELEDVKNGPKP